MNLFKLLFFRKLDKAGDAGAPGGGGNDGKSALSSGKPGDDGKPPSSLNDGKGTPAPGPNDWVPEKYRVFKEDKTTLDVEASARKLAGGYGELNTRMKDAGLPPESPEKYEVTGIEDPVKSKVDAFLKDKENAPFLKKAHGMGLSNKQLSLVLSEYVGRAEQLALGGAALSAEECDAELAKHWKSPAEVDQQKGLAFRAVTVAASMLGAKPAEVEAMVEQIDEALGNNPWFIRIMAGFGAEMREDAAPNAQGGFGSDGKTFEEQDRELRKQLDALPVHDPSRKAIKEKLDRLWEAKYPSRKPVFASG